MKKISLLAIALLMTIAVSAQKWTLDKAHSKLTFTVTHLLMSEVDGVFKSFDASITSSKEDFSDATFELTADMTKVTTNNDMRDGHLQKEDIFNTDEFQTITFTSTGIKRPGGNQYAPSGNLTLKGVTKPLTLNLTKLGTGTNRQGKKLVGFKVTGTIKRTDFGVGAMPAAVVAEDVELTASGEFALN